MLVDAINIVTRLCSVDTNVDMFCLDKKKQIESVVDPGFLVRVCENGHKMKMYMQRFYMVHP